MSLTVSVETIVEESSDPRVNLDGSWPRMRLGDVVAIQNGGAFKSAQFSPTDGMPLIRIRDLSGTSTSMRYQGDYDSRYVVENGDLLVGMDGDFKVARWNGDQAVLNQRVCKLTVEDESLCEPRFLDLVLPPFLQAIHEYTSSQTVKHLSSKDIAEIPLPLPPREQQQRIISAVSTARKTRDGIIDRVDAGYAATTTLRSAVIAAAVTGRLTDDWRESHASSGAELVAESIDELQALGGRPKKKIEEVVPLEDVEIPESWTWAPLGWLAQIQGGIQKQPKRQPRDNAYPYLRVANVLRGALDLTEILEFELEPGELPKYRLERGDLLVVEGNGSLKEIGRSAIWDNEIEDCVHQNHIIRARCLRMNPLFVQLFWNSQIGSKELADLAVTSAGLYSLSAGKLAAFALPVPPADEQDEIVSRVQAALDRIELAERRIDLTGEQIRRLPDSVLVEALNA